MHTFEGDSVLCKFVVCSPPSVTPSHDLDYIEALLLNSSIQKPNRGDEYDSLHSYIGVHVHAAVLDSTSILAGKSGPSAQDRYCARGL